MTPPAKPDLTELEAAIAHERSLVVGNGTYRGGYTAWRKANRAVRDAAIKALGWAPEGRADTGDDYAADTGNLIRWAREGAS